MRILLCLSPVYTKWRGEVGDIVVLCFFSLAFIINASVGFCVIRVSLKSTSKLSNCFLAKFFAANMLVTFSQVIISLAKKESDGFKFSFRVIPDIYTFIPVP